MAVERLVAVVIVEDLTHTEMIPHEEAKAQFTSWSNYIISSYSFVSVTQEADLPL